jgi:hypothetical protein
MGASPPDPDPDPDPDALTLPAMPSGATLRIVLNAAAANELGALCSADLTYARVCRDEVVWRRVCRTTRCPPKPPVRQWLHHYVRSKRPAYGPRVDGALLTASQNGRAEDVRLLLAAGADANASDGGAVQLATAAGHADVVRLLLAAGARAP